MHELSVTKNVLQLVLEYAEASKADKVLGVQLEIGEMRDIVGNLMQKCFGYLARGTIAENATLKIKEIPLTCICRSCKTVFPVNPQNGFECLSCPQCGSVSLAPYTGLELSVRSIEVI